jgi:hypothetical protein
VKTDAERSRAYATRNAEKRRASSRAYYARNREAIRAKARAHRAANREACLARSREYTEANRQKTREWSNACTKRKQEALAGRPRPDACEVCGRVATTRALHLDHDHRTGAFRGWLCNNCNTVLGLVADDVEILDKLIVYLARSRRPKLASKAPA